MKIYNVTRGQLITIWVFGVIATFISLVELDSYDPSGWATVFLILIPFTLIFYSIGWKSYREQSVKKEDEKNVSHCTTCGIKISDDSKYCKSCGKNLYV